MKRFCRHGHEKSGDNLYIIPSSGRGVCRKCKEASRPQTDFEQGKWPRLPIMERLLARRKVNEITGCWEWQGSREQRGYGFIWWEGRQWLVHRAMAVLSGILNDFTKMVMHKCDNPPCFNPEHLKEGTGLENMQDCVSKNRIAVGVRHGRSRLHKLQREAANGERQGW